MMDSALGTGIHVSLTKIKPLEFDVNKSRLKVFKRYEYMNCVSTEWRKGVTK